MRFRGWRLHILLALVTVPGFGQEAPASVQGVLGLPIARYADGQVICQELLAATDRPADRRGRRLGPAADIPPSIEEWRDLTAELVVERLLARDARAIGIDGDPEIAARVRRFRQNERLTALEAQLAEGIEISAAQIRALYEQEPERTHSPRKLVSRFLLRRVPDGASAERIEAVRQEVEALRDRFLEGEPFADLARAHSEAENASRGGMVAARPRGSLLSTYEEVAWKMEPGQISGAVRLPHGWALVLVENFLPERRFSLAEATPRLRSILEQRELDRRREGLLAEARRRWPTTRGEGPASDPEAEIFYLGEQRFELRDLGLQHRPPRLEQRIEQALDRERLAMLARQHLDPGLGGIDRRAARLQDALLAQRSLARRVEARLPEVAEVTLRKLYERRKKSLRTPEERSFEGWFYAGTEGQLRKAHTLASEAAAAWRKGEPIPTGGQPIRWGPLPRTTLGNSLSPRFAAAAFEQVPQSIGSPLRMEGYDSGSLRFRPEGYVVLRARVSRAEQIPSFAAARDRLRRIALRRRIPEIEQAVRQEILREAELEMLAEGLSRCLAEPAPASSRPEGSAPGARQESRHRD